MSLPSSPIKRAGLHWRLAGQTPPSVALMVRLSLHTKPGKRLVNVPVNEPGPSFNAFNALLEETLTDPVKLPPVTSPSCAIIHVNSDPPMPGIKIMPFHVPETGSRIVLKDVTGVEKVN